MSVVEEVQEIITRALPDQPEAETIILRLLDMGLSDSQVSPQPTRKPWPQSFQVPWNLMPSEIRTAVSSDKRPSPAARRQMVRIVADEMRKYDPNPSRAECLIVCRSIVHQYPNSFADLRENGQFLDGGCSSLVIQVKNRLENLNRNSTIRQYRAASNGQKRGPTDTYGCTQFQPSLPTDESEESMESKRQQLEGIYSHNGIHGADRAEVKQLMDITFYLQRCHINALPPPTIAHLKTKWPYLFTQKGFISHFQLLTDVCLLRTLAIAMEDCGNIIVEMLKAKPTNAGVKDILNQADAELPYKRTSQD
ncbi:uncharacterized protein LOC121711169 [Alosa sapidissima]|uniref:uncharacterized protein LOC121711169 n=1 Tax=Alosa sapidissima TaxID=34773 RepID=UPI001C0A5BE6|nr:uncharacterized protein LOC121711169 [Alosa sapidissima]